MKESVAIAKEANRKQGSSPNKSDNDISHLRNEPERQIGSLRSVVGNIRRNGNTASVESISTELSVMPSTDRASALLALQQTHGNRYVQRVVTGIQAKLKIGQPGDIYEQEADRVAEQVMQMPEPQVQRQVEPEEEEEEEAIQAKPLAEQITPLIQKQPIEGENVSPSLGSRINAIRGGGQPLSASTRAFVEPRFGYDFSQVRVHSDDEANRLSSSLNAQAFTTGQDIFFRQGAYNPGSLSSRKLLAHELAHVLQQNGMAQNKIQRRELRGEDFPWQGVVANCSVVWFRKEAKMGDNKIQALTKGTEVKVTGKSGNWLKVEYGGKNGYIYKNYTIHKFEVEAQKDIGGVCDEKACLTISGCTISNCKKESAIIAEKYVSRVNAIRKPNIANVGDRHWGWLCYQWAGLLMREFSKLNLKCWKINWVGIVGGGGSLEHNYIFVSLEDITPSGTAAPKRGCGMILDPWRAGDPIVYSVSWTWHKWNYIHNPITNSGKSYTGGTWSDVTYPPPWTPAEPAASPTITVP